MRMVTPSPLVIGRLRLALAVTGGLAAALGPSEGRAGSSSESVRVQRRLTVSGAANAIMPSVGADVSYHPFDRFAVGIQLTTIVAHTDVSLRGRGFLLASRNAGLYVGANLHGWHSPLILSAVTAAGTLELGYEFRSDGGFTVGLGLGAGLIRVPKGSEGAQLKAHWDPLPLFNLRLGKSR